MKDAAFCYYCRLFCCEKSGRGEDNFTRKGVSNWKKAFEKFRKHEKSEMHLKSLQFWNEKKISGNTICGNLSYAHTKQVQQNRTYLRFVIETILFLGKQCLALRGHDETMSSLNKGNFLELLQLRAKDKGVDIIQMMSSKIHSYKSGQIQNEIINIIKNKIVVDIVNEKTGIDLSKLRGQAYDGASNMSGKFNGVAAKFKDEEPRALYTLSRSSS
ncbi:zinc finger MYM-type protein 1-like [Uloborus diversus]|uniref:zinc finger MYM-type protein 1-like n=1 Tax=Uloborus diversus TaxID=327109 RepID=UPI0024092BAE|nr:zinc finger MYM-type protein 1-like [Uloborus diversus]